jgi:hypothetical protein
MNDFSAGAGRTTRWTSRSSAPACAGSLRERPGFHLAHRRLGAAIAPDPLFRNNLALLKQLRAMPDEALRRMCEVTMQLAGNPNMHRPMEKLE